MTDDRIQYLLDRIEIQDKVALYGLGQDLHQADSGDGDVLAQWKDLFTADAKIDATDGLNTIFGLDDYAKLMRGENLLGGTEGLGHSFDAWQHIEGHATVTIDGDTAHSIAPHLHTHSNRDGSSNTFAVGYWHDDWIRTSEGWRISYRRVQNLYFHTFPRAANPQILPGA
ncbi:nuclear transport factor 2 family protein [Mycolicibacterium baixiangningiae]|uniref:nuclear transport factor 2 family protein n=1 Tax=Mycolicibacterium baixiangningiae TaxID=2761578 RepID=UPI0018D0FB6B|nr:nuclear transport factor 2 family protein [Mycolicibacterium baixiangningiae]